MQFKGESYHEILQRLRTQVEQSAVIFSQIAGDQITAKMPVRKPIFDEADRQNFSQLLYKTTSIRTVIAELEDSSDLRVEQTYQRLTIIIGIFALMLAISTILTSIHLGRLIIKRLAALYEGAKIIAAGNLNFRISDQGSDEFTDLAKLINSMTDNLQTFTQQLETEISERKVLDDNRKEALNLLQKIASRVPGVVYQYLLRPDGSSCFPYSSEAIREIYRVSPEDVREDASQVFNKIYPEDMEGLLSSILKSAQDFSPWQYEYRVEFSDGTVNWLYGSGIPEKEFDGAVLWHGFISNINERKQVEQALQIEGEKNRALLRNASDGIHILDEEGNVIEASDSFCAMLGYQRSEVIGKNISLWDLKFSGSEGALALGKMFQQQNRSQFETRHRRKNGSWYDVEVSYSPLMQEGKTVLFNSSRDITERKRTEKMLRENEINSQAMLNNELIGIVKIKNRCIQWANPAFEKMLGYQNGELDGTPTRQNYLTAEAYETLGALAYPVLRQGKIFRSEIEHRRKDGRVIWVALSGSILNPETGESLWGFLETTDRVMFEQELKRSNDELEQFSYAISHDLRQPLRMISSYLQLIKMSLNEKLDPENREHFKFAIDGAQRLDKMLVGLLEYSRVSRRSNPCTWVESRALVDEAVMFLQPAIEEAQAKLDISGLWPRVWVSRDEIERLFLNLIGNAVKYRVAGTLPKICIVSEIRGNQWHLTVTDNGIGINPAQLGRLFQVFQRLHTHASYEGNGIGLALCRRIVEHHGGRIWAESAGEGQGSTFFIELIQDKQE
jgi:PAS domain S-box-containing protein